MSKIRLHILAVPHTITRDEYSHCAFTGKVQRFSPMMRSRGYEVFHYGVETSESGADKDINILTKNEWEKLRFESYKKLHNELTDEEINNNLNDHTKFVGELGNWSTPLYEEFNRRLKIELKENYRDILTDIVCLPFGPAHEDAIKNENFICVETGIGYPNSYKNFRIFESYSKLHLTLADQEDKCKNYWFVVPNYYNSNEFLFNQNPFLSQLPDGWDPYPENTHIIGFFGRITDIKGCSIFCEVAKRFPHIKFILCGQGDPSKYLISENIEYRAPIAGADRTKYLGSLSALIAPSKFVEPFCGVAVESQLCGTPVITQDFGAMVETVENFKTGLNCHTLGDYCYGVRMVLDNKFDRKYIHDRAVKLYDMYNVAKKYDYVFKSILDINNGNGGWYSENSYIENLQPDF